MHRISGHIDALVSDLDGVLYRGDVPIEGAAEAIRRLRSAGIALLFCTNNSRPTVDRYVDKLRGAGVEASPHEILTSAVVTGEVLRDKGIGAGTAFVVGGPGAVAAVREAGLVPVDGEEGSQADVVVVGWDRDFTWDKMRIAATAVREGAVFVATNSDPTYPSPEGLWPGAGSILASIERASGRSAEVMGKPNAPMMRVAAQRLKGCSAIAMVGDRDDTDLAGARSMGWMTILALSGVTDRAAADHLDPQPDLIIESLAELQ